MALFEEKQDPLQANASLASRANQARLTQERVATQTRPVKETLPKMKPPARFQDPENRQDFDVSQSRIDPVLSAAAQRGERPSTSVLRSDGVMRSLIGEREGGELVPIEDERTKQPIKPDTQEGLSNNPVIPVPRYMEAPDKTANSLGFKRMIDTRGNVPENHLGTYTNLGNDQFNSEMERMNSQTKEGGGFRVIPNEQMNAQISGRVITGKLPSGGSYRYHLKPGQHTPDQTMRLEQREQDRLNERDNWSRAQSLGFLHRQQARKLELLNDLASRFMQDGEPELAAQMLDISKSTGVIPESEYGVTSQKQYDNMGNVTGESPIFYQKNAQGRPVAYRADDVLQGQSQTYEEALAEALELLATDTSHFGEIDNRMSQAYPEQYDPKHLNQKENK